MAQICNVSYSMQAGAFTDEDEFDRWDAELVTAPGERPKRKRRAPRKGERTAADLMAGGGTGNV